MDQRQNAPLAGGPMSDDPMTTQPELPQTPEDETAIGAVADAGAEAGAQAATGAVEPLATARAQSADATPADAAQTATSDGLIEPALIPPRGLVATTLALLVVTCALAIAVAPGVKRELQPQLQLTFWHSDDRELDEIVRRDDRLLAADAKRQTDLARTQEAGLRKNVTQWLALEAQMGTLQVQHDGQARQILGQIEETVRTIGELHGVQAVQAMAVRWGRDVAHIFGQVVAGARQRQMQVGDEMVDPPAVALQALAPGLIKLLADSGLAAHGQGQGQGLTVAAQLVVQALAQSRFLQFAVRVPQAPHLATDLQALLLRFRIEAHAGLRVERKLELIQTMVAADPTYPASFVAGVLWAREGRCDRAAPAFAQAIQRGENLRLAQANLAWCQSLMGH